MQALLGPLVSASPISSQMAQYWFLAPIIIFGLILADTSLTYSSIRDLSARYELRLVAALETNGLVRNSLVRHGLRKGIIRAELILLIPYIFLLGFVTAIWITVPVLFGFIAGLLTFNVIRWVNLRRNLSSYHACPHCRTIHRTSPFLPPESSDASPFFPRP